MAGTVASRLKGQMHPAVAAYTKSESGVMQQLYTRESVQSAFESLGVCDRAKERTTRCANDHAASDEADDEQTAQPHVEQQQSAHSRASELSAERLALYRSARPALAGELPLAVLRTITKLMLSIAALPDDLLGDLYPFEDYSDDNVRAYIDIADRGEVQQLLCDLIIGDDLSVHDWDAKTADTDQAHMALHTIAMAMSSAPPISEQAEQPQSDVTNNPAARPKLMLKQKAETPTTPHQDGPVIKVKKVRTPVTPDAAWPFPTNK